MKRINRQSLIPIIIMAIGGVLFVGSLLLSQRSIIGEQENRVVDVERGANIPHSEVKRVSLADAKAAFDLETAVFIDVRDEFSYNQGHIPEARSIPLDSILQSIDQLEPTQWYILYCT